MQLVKLDVDSLPDNYRTSVGRSGTIFRKGACSADFIFRPHEGEELHPKITLLSKKEGLQFLFDVPEGETVEIEYSRRGVLSLIPFFEKSIPFYQ